MPFSGMLRHMYFVRTDVSEERIASLIKVTRIGELLTLAATTNRCTMRRKPRATRRPIPEDGILRSHRRENLKYYKSYYDSKL
jgi:hypothetical protein